MEKYPTTPIEVVTLRKCGPKSDLYSLGHQFRRLASQLGSLKLRRLCKKMMTEDVAKRVNQGQVIKVLQEIKVKAAKNGDRVQPQTAWLPKVQKVRGGVKQPFWFRVARRVFG